MHAERIVREYLADELLEGTPPPGDCDLFAVEGGTAAMCYVFDSSPRTVLRPGDRGRSWSPPSRRTSRFPARPLRTRRRRALRVQRTRRATASPTWQFPDEEIDKLADPSVRALFVVNPSNPPSVMLAPATSTRIAAIVATTNPDLVVVTDDVYGTFVEGFCSLIATLPQNIIAVYSFSKYFGATGWRFGVIAVSQDNVFDRKLAALPEPDQVLLADRYDTLSVIRGPFSSSIAWSPTAGRSRPTTPPVSRCRSRCR